MPSWSTGCTTASATRSVRRAASLTDSCSAIRRLAVRPSTATTTSTTARPRRADRTPARSARGAARRATPRAAAGAQGGRADLRWHVAHPMRGLGAASGPAARSAVAAMPAVVVARVVARAVVGPTRRRTRCRIRPPSCGRRPGRRRLVPPFWAAVVAGLRPVVPVDEPAVVVGGRGRRRDGAAACRLAVGRRRRPRGSIGRPRLASRCVRGPSARRGRRRRTAWVGGATGTDGLRLLLPARPTAAGATARTAAAVNKRMRFMTNSLR